MPTGTTSYRSGSRAAITLPAETHEIACSVLRPPKTTATRTLPALPLIAEDSSRAPVSDPPAPPSRSPPVQRGGEVGDEVVGVLDAAGEPHDPLGAGAPPPLRPPVGRAVHAAEAGRRRPQPA